MSTLYNFLGSFCPWNVSVFFCCPCCQVDQSCLNKQDNSWMCRQEHGIRSSPERPSIFWRSFGCATTGFTLLEGALLAITVNTMRNFCNDEKQMIWAHIITDLNIVVFLRAFLDEACGLSNLLPPDWPDLHYQTFFLLAKNVWLSAISSSCHTSMFFELSTIQRLSICGLISWYEHTHADMHIYSAQPHDRNICR